MWRPPAGRCRRRSRTAETVFEQILGLERFAQRFKDVGSSGTAFAANLLGAMVGGTLEYFSLITGYRASLILAAVLYGLAFVTGRRRSAEMAPVPSPKQPLGVST